MSLPKGYIELEYIESTGTQCIDTGFKPDENTRVKAEFDITFIDPESTYGVFGGRTATSTNAFVVWIIKGKIRNDHGSNTTNSEISASVGKFLFDKNKNILTVNGQSIEAPSAIFESKNTLALFTTKGETTSGNSDSNGFDNRRLIAKLYSAEIYNNGTLVRNMIPCKNESDQIGLYDTVNSKFYTNVGTGSFIAGPIIYPPFSPKVNINGTWKKCSVGYVNINGTWKKIEKGYVNVNGVWKEIT